MISTHKQLISNLEYLGMKQMQLHLDEVIDFTLNNSLSFTDALIKLTSHEIDFKEVNLLRTLVKVAAFPHLKELSSFEFDFQASINKQQILEFLSLKFLEKTENIVFLGPSGVGKTHLATSIGIAVAKKRYSSYFIKCHDLVLQLKKAQLENRLEARLRHFMRYKCLIIDEIGYLPIDDMDAKLLFQLIDRRYEKKSTIVTTNIGFGDWDKIFGDPAIANAILDRLLHHASIIPITGKSYRLKDVILQSDD